MVYILNVPKEVAAGLTQSDRRDLADQARQLYAKRTASTGVRVIDSEPADGGKYRTQQDWIAFFNEQKKPMVSAPDIYRVGKGGQEKLVESLREDFDKRWETTSTRISYSPDTLNAKVIHNYGSTVVQPHEKQLIVPVYTDTTLDSVLGISQGVKYLRTLFDTNDNDKSIAQALTALSGKNVRDIYVWTPTQESRAQKTERAVGFDFGRDGFRVNGDFWVGGYVGRSRGVSVEVGSAKPTRKK